MAKTPAKPKPKARVKGKGGLAAPWRRATAIVVGVVAVAVVLRVVAVQGVRAPSRSMEDTLQAGDCLLVDKLTYGALLPFGAVRLPGVRSPEVGDVVVFRYPADPQRTFVKRCLAVAGQIVEIRDKVVYIDGTRQVDPPFSKYVDARIFSAASSGRDNLTPREVPAGTIFVVGDNRDNSRDSRDWGFLPLESVVGRALAVYWSTAPLADGSAGLWARAWGGIAGVRWSRLGVGVE